MNQNKTTESNKSQTALCNIDGVVPRCLSSINYSDVASLNSLSRDLGWELINQGNFLLKLNLNPKSQFEKRIVYIINRFNNEELSKECPYQIYLYLKSEGFNV